MNRPVSTAGFLPFLTLLLATIFLTPTARAGTQSGPGFVVNSLADTDDGSCDLPGQGTGNKDCTLREAINAANAYGDGVTITFAVSGTISLGSALPAVNRSMTIDGSGQKVVIDGNTSVQLFFLRTVYSQFVYITVNFKALTFARGSLAILGVFADANVSNCSFDSNRNGGGAGSGGAINLGNQSAPAYVTNCTFYNNQGPNAGGILANNLVITNCTFSGNSATFSNNPGAINATGSATIRNCIIANSPNGLNCIGGNFDASNIADDASCGSSTRATLAQINLGPLQDNGGPSKTMALLPGSVAIGAGNTGVSGAAPVNNKDQRGYGRVGSGDTTSDVGAYEYNTPGPDSVPPTILPASGGTYESSVTVSFSGSTPGSVFYYTTDGTTPVPNNLTTYLYTGPFVLSRSATVRAVTTASGYANSTISSAGYTIQYPISVWRTLQSLPSNGSQDLANPSGDGVPNLLKYAFNLAPSTGDLALPNAPTLPVNGTAGLPRVGADTQGRLTMEFLRRKSSNTPGIAYSVETGANLADWASLDLSSASVTSIDNIWERVSVTDPTLGQKRFGRVRVVSTPIFANDFNYYPIFTTLYGNASVINEQSVNGAIQLTNEVTAGQGWAIFDGPAVGPSNRGFRALFRLQLGPSTVVPADGVSFAVGDLPTSGWGESGPGTAHSLAVGFDTYSNGGAGDVGIHLWVNGVHITSNPVNPFTNGQFVQVEISYDVSTGVTVIYNGNTVLSNVPVTGFSFLTTDKFGMGGRTGAAKERAVVDDMQIAPR